MNSHERAGHRTAKVQPASFRPTRLGTSLLRDPLAPVSRAIHNDAERPTIGVLDHQDDRFHEIRVKLMGGRHQKMALKRLHVQVSLVVVFRFTESLSIRHVPEDLVRKASLGGDAQLIEAAALAFDVPSAYAAQVGHDLDQLIHHGLRKPLRCRLPDRSRMAVAVFITRTKRARLRSGVDSEPFGSSTSSATGTRSTFAHLCNTLSG